MAVLPGLRGAWDTVEDAAAALETLTGGRALLVVDDAHTLEATPAEQALGRLVEYAPTWLAIVIGSRVTPGFNLTRLRVSGGLLEIGPTSCAWREVERCSATSTATRSAGRPRRARPTDRGLWPSQRTSPRAASADERRRILTGAGTSSLVQASTI
jgi:hypothetical protein